MNFAENEIKLNNENLSSGADIQNLGERVNPSENESYSKYNFDFPIPNSVQNDIQALDKLVKNGLITSQQGLNILCERVIDAKKKCSQEKVKSYDLSSDEFLKKPEYSAVLEYLQESNVNFEADDISKIVDLVKNIEQQAVEKYLKTIDYNEKLNAENMLAKQRLSTSAKKERADFSAPIFTREMIGKMNGTEFVKNEKAIMEQLKKGLIR